LPNSGSTTICTGAYFLVSGRRATISYSLSNNGPAGTLSFNYRDNVTNVQFKSTGIVTYSLSGVTQGANSGYSVDFTVVGTVNGQPGYIVTGTGVDLGAAGSGLDNLSITVRTPTGTVIFSGGGAVAGGDITIAP